MSLTKKKMFDLADRSLDPAGILAIFGAMMVEKFTEVEFTAQEVLWASLALGALRTLWEGFKRRRHADALEQAESRPGMRPF